MKTKKQKKAEEREKELRTKDFFDCIAPATMKFTSEYYITGDSYRSVWAVREYPPTTEQQALFFRLADKSGVTLRVYIALSSRRSSGKSYRTRGGKTN